MKRKIDVGGLSQFYTGRKELSPTMQLEYTLKEAVDPEKLQDALNRAAGVFSVFRVRIALDNRRPVYEETESGPAVYRDDERQKAFFLSYLGKMDLPEDLAEHTESFFSVSPTTRGPLRITAYSWKNELILNVTEQACEKSIIPELQGILDRYATKSRKADHGMKCYDYYPMEELTGREA